MYSMVGINYGKWDGNTCISESSKELPPYYNEEKEYYSSNRSVLAEHGIEINLACCLPILFGFGTQ